LIVTRTHQRLSKHNEAGARMTSVEVVIWIDMMTAYIKIEHRLLVLSGTILLLKLGIPHDTSSAAEIRLQTRSWRNINTA
jgi:hypothetical protein